jgi:hypothetical protein
VRKWVLALVCLTILLSCGPVTHTSVPQTQGPSAATLTPTATQTTPAPASPPTLTTPFTPVPEATPGLAVEGYVRLADGSGLAGVAICRRLASYPGQVVATTDAEGYFQAGFAYIPGDEMVTIWPLLDGYFFQPEANYWRHYYGHEVRSMDFVAAHGAATSSFSPDANLVCP